MCVCTLVLAHSVNFLFRCLHVDEMIERGKMGSCAKMQLRINSTVGPNLKEGVLRSVMRRGRHTILRLDIKLANMCCMQRMHDLNNYPNGQEKKMDSFDQAPSMHIMRNGQCKQTLIFTYIFFIYLYFSFFNYCHYNKGFWGIFSSSPKIFIFRSAWIKKK